MRANRCGICWMHPSALPSFPPLLSFPFTSFAKTKTLRDTIRDNCHCHSHHLHVSPCPTPRTSALNNCPCPDAVSLCHNPLNPWTLTCFNEVHEASSFGRLNWNSFPLNSWLIGIFFLTLLICTVVYCPPAVVSDNIGACWWDVTTLQIGTSRRRNDMATKALDVFLERSPRLMRFVRHLRPSH